MEPMKEFGDNLIGVQREDPENNRAVLFVHGFGGDPVETWTNKTSKKCFPLLLAQDNRVRNYDVFSFGYVSGVGKGQTITDVADGLRDAIDHHLSRYTLVLVAHSMGGLVCMSYITRQLELERNPPVAGLMMYATPTNGIEFLRVAKLFSLTVSSLLPKSFLPNILIFSLG